MTNFVTGTTESKGPRKDIAGIVRGRYRHTWAHASRGRHKPVQAGCLTLLKLKTHGQQRSQKTPKHLNRCAEPVSC